MRGAVLGGAVALLTGTACLPQTQADEAIAFELPHPAASTAAPGPSLASSGNSAVVLVTIDGARWQDVFVDANMPHLHALAADRGATLGAPGRGPGISASGPAFVSLPGYSEIFTGRRAHGCADNDCGPARAPTVFDEARDHGEDVAVFASWERIASAVTPEQGSVVLSTGRSVAWRLDDLRDDPVAMRLLDDGAHADPFPGEGDFRPDRFTAALALHYLETRRPRLLYVGLGETDEYAHRGDYPGYLASLRASDAVLGELFAILDRMGDRGARTTVIVTADHGRAHDWRDHGRGSPESARVWLLAAGSAVTARGPIRANRAHRLADVAPTVRALLDLPADGATTSGMAIEELFVPAAEERRIGRR